MVFVDIGGGSVPNGTRNSLARIPLRWMIRQCFLVNTGIQFHYDSFKDIGLDPNTLSPFVTPRLAALKPSAATVAEVKASAHSAEPTDATLTDEAQASPKAASTFKSEEDEELVDALSPIYDQLKLAKAWWILEILPLRHRAQNRKDSCRKPYWQYVFFLKFLPPLCVAHAGVVVLPPQDKPWPRSTYSRTSS
jgi:hypothetical protein